MSESFLSVPVELKIPAQPSMMLIVRLTTSGIVARAGLTIDQMDDVKMAVEEACNCLIDIPHRKDALHITFSVSGDYLVIHVCGDGNCGGEPVPPEKAAEMDVIRCILDSLVDSVDMRMHSGILGAIEMKIALNM